MTPKKCRTLRITSLQNPRILALRKLYKSRERKVASVFLVEGVREVLRGLQSGFEVKELYFCPEILKEAARSQITAVIEDTLRVTELSKKVYEKLAYRDNTEGVLAVFEKREYGLDALLKEDQPLIVLLEGLEKPGNLGAVLRTADAAGVSGIIITGNKIDSWHPNVLRASQGAAFKIPVVMTTNEAVLEWSETHKIPVMAAALPAYASLYEMSLTGASILAFGTEAKGLSLFWLQHATNCFTIPMEGIVDSLNVSVSVAVTLYEARRQRGRSI